MGETHKRNMVRSRSLLLLLAALASTVVAATASADWKRGLDAIVTKLQTNDDASALVQEVDTIVSENRDPAAAVSADAAVADATAAFTAAAGSATSKVKAAVANTTAAITTTAKKAAAAAASTAAAVKDELTTMIQQGKKQDECEKLAEDLCEAVSEHVKMFDAQIGSLSDGSDCKDKGQIQVKKTTLEVNTWETTLKTRTDEATKLATAGV